MNHFLHRCWFPCKASLSAGGRWASSSLPLLRGLTCSAFPAGVFALPSTQPLEATTHIKSTFTLLMKKIRTRLILHQESNAFESPFNENTFIPASLVRPTA